MKLKLDKKYLKICIYVAITFMFMYLFTVVVDYAPSILSTFLNFLDGFMELLSPLIVAFIIAYLLYGPMHAIETFLLKRKFFSKHRGLCRAIGLAVSYISIIAIIITIICGMYFMIGGQISNSSTLSNILDTITEYFATNSFSAESVQSLISNWNIPFGDFLTDKLGDIATFLSDVLVAFIGDTGNFILSIGSNIFSFIISLVLSIYLLASYEYFHSLCNKIFFLVFRNSKMGKSVRRCIHIVNQTFSKYIHGQLIEAFIVFILSTIVLTIVGIDYAFVIGIICGVCNLIPYIGPFVGIVFAAIMALFSGDFLSILWSIIGLMIVQQIDCNILCPKIVGDIVGLNAAFTLIAISIGGDLAGLIGMLIAVPVAASIKLIIGDWFDRHIKNDFDEYSEALKKEKEGEQKNPENQSNQDTQDN